MAQMVKNLPGMQENWVQSLGWEAPLEKGMATHSILAWRIPQTEEPGGLHFILEKLKVHLWLVLYFYWRALIETFSAPSLS